MALKVKQIEIDPVDFWENQFTQSNLGSKKFQDTDGFCNSTFLPPSKIYDLPNLLHLGAF